MYNFLGIWLEGEHGLFQSVLLKKVVIEPNVKLECVPKSCYLCNTLGGVEEARARVRCAWAKFKGCILLRGPEMLLKVDCLPNAFGKQPSILLINLGRKWTLSC